jgi:hypothetical protein
MLEVINVFKAYHIESPIKLLKEEEKKRKRAGKSKKTIKKQSKEDVEW